MSAGFLGRAARHPAIVLVPLALAAALAARTVARDSCTVDEFGNLPLTVSYWSGGALHIDRGNPPLTRWIQGLALLPLHPDPGGNRFELATIETSWDLGYRFERAHPDDYHALLVRARAGSVVLLLLTVLGVWVWARDLAGPTAALGSALLAAASPNLLAHGRLVTPDIGLACLTVWAAWAAWRAGRSGRHAWTVAAGGLAGAAALAKFSGLLLLPALGLAVAAAPGTPGRRLGRVALFGAASLAILYAGYGFPTPGAFRGWPTPLPAPVMNGIAVQLAEAPYPGYLLGEVREGGWPWYYFVAFLVKVPLPAIALFAVGAVVAVRERRTETAMPWLLAGAFLVAFGLGTRKNVGLRYILPVLPLLHVAAAAALSCAPRAAARAAMVLAFLAVVSGVAASRTPLAYFNGVERLAGGKRAVLADSNLDWGQALPDLKDWMEREGIETIRLAYFGRIDPTMYGIRWRSLPSEPVTGPMAISATLAVGRPYVVRFKERPFLETSLAWSGPETWEWIRTRTPDAELGGGAILAWRDLRPTGGAEEGGP